MLRLDPAAATVQQVHKMLLGGVGPRPIALVSTLSADGKPNLSPFSFFNAFGANPPVVAFSPARRGRDGSLKDTYHNLMATGECVIQAVTHAMVEQVSLASTEYPTGVNEFLKSGLTPVPSEAVKPFRVKESPFQMECRLLQMVPLGSGNGSGNLAICQVLLFHVDEAVLTNGMVDPAKINLVARMGGDFYTHASSHSLFTVRKPLESIGIGYDSLPPVIRQSGRFTGNHLGKLANIQALPTEEEVKSFYMQHAAPAAAGEQGLGSALRAVLAAAPVKRQLLEEVVIRALDEDNISFAILAAMLLTKPGLAL